MPLIFAIIALNLAFVVYLFISLRSSPEGFWDKVSLRAKSQPQVTRAYQFYDAFSGRQPQFARARSNAGEY